MAQNNSKDEHDVIERRITFGPGVRAVAMFVCLAGTFGGGWYLCKQNTKGDIAESEIEVRKDDAKVSIDIDKDLVANTQRVEHEHSERSYNSDCAGLTIDDLRGGLRESEVD